MMKVVERQGALPTLARRCQKKILQCLGIGGPSCVKWKRKVGRVGEKEGKVENPIAWNAL